MKTDVHRKIYFVSTAAILIILFSTIYSVVQQAQRSAANSPQIQMAEDLAARLNNGTNPKDIHFAHINIGSSLSTFEVVYTRSGQPVNGSGYLNGGLPMFPAGALTSSNTKDYSAVTWQPLGSLRYATVSVSAGNYYVMSGRSIKQVEINENRTFDLAAFGCTLSLIVLCGTYFLTGISKNK